MSSGNSGALLHRRPLRTQHATFSALGSSLKAPCSGTRKHFGVNFINRFLRASKYKLPHPWIVRIGSHSDLKMPLDLGASFEKKR